MYQILYWGGIIVCSIILLVGIPVYVFILGKILALGWIDGLKAVLSDRKKGKGSELDA